MNLSRVFSLAQKFIADNSPTILTVIGVTGTVTTAVLASRASFKAAEILSDVAPEEDLTTRDKFECVWRLYIPAVGVGTGTIACVIGANRIGTRRAAAMAAAFSISEKMFDEYRGKVVEKLGKAHEQKLRDDLAQDRVTNNPVSSKEVIFTGTGSVLCYDTITGRYFESDVESLRRAQNDINHRILTDMYASLGDFYTLIGLPETPYSQEVGWNADILLDLKFSAVLSEENRPCISMDYKVFPIRGFCRLL